MALVLIIADDLTGALECGARFAQCGLDSSVQVGGCVLGSDADAVVIDTESRHLTCEDAAAAVRQAAAGYSGLIYKKTDSTLRGNIGAELSALSALYPEYRIAYVPAYPAMGRTVRSGILLVKGEPVSETDFGRDLLNPVRDSRVRSIIGDALDCAVFDGETDGDVESAADAILEDPAVRIVAGPSAIGAAIASRITKRSQFAVDWPIVRTALIVNGSRHEASARQVEQLRRPGCLPSSWQILERDIAPGEDPLQVARDTGLLATSAAQHLDALIVFGGDTAFGVLAAWGTPLVRPIGEILPGVAVSRVDGRQTLLITKPGGYAGDDLLCRLAAFANLSECRG